MSTFALETEIAGRRRDPILTAPMAALCGMIAMAMGSFYLLLSAVPAHAAALGGELAAGSTTTALMATTIVGEVIAPRLIARLGRRFVTAMRISFTGAMPVDARTVHYEGCVGGRRPGDFASCRKKRRRSVDAP